MDVAVAVAALIAVATDAEAVEPKLDAERSVHGLVNGLLMALAGATNTHLNWPLVAPPPALPQCMEEGKSGFDCMKETGVSGINPQGKATKSKAEMLALKQQQDSKDTE
eukprot:363147-Chlamydomonas_euryale.AAC.5